MPERLPQLDYLSRPAMKSVGKSGSIAQKHIIEKRSKAGVKLRKSEFLLQAISPGSPQLCSSHRVVQ